MGELSVNWTAAGVVLVVLAALGTGAVKAFKAPASLQGNHAEQRTRARSSIEADHVLPKLKALVLRLAEQADLSSDALSDAERRPQREELLAVQLQDVTSLNRLRAIGNSYGDHFRIDNLLSWAERGALVRAVALSILIICLLPFATWAAVKGLSLSNWLLWLAGSIGAVATVAAAGAFVMESFAERRLVRLLRRYA